MKNPGYRLRPWPAGPVGKQQADGKIRRNREGFVGITSAKKMAGANYPGHLQLVG